MRENDIPESVQQPAGETPTEVNCEPVTGGQGDLERLAEKIEREPVEKKVQYTRVQKLEGQKLPDVPPRDGLAAQEQLVQNRKAISVIREQKKLQDKADHQRGDHEHGDGTVRSVA